MKVILLKDIKGTGTKDQVIEVSDGFARNYLLPRKLAVEASASTLNTIENAKNAAKHREDTKKTAAEEKARELKGKVIQMKAKAGESGKLYGSITTAEIAEKIKEQYGLVVDKHKLELDEPIRKIGQAPVTVRLNAGVSTRMLINVTVEQV